MNLDDERWEVVEGECGPELDLGYDSGGFPIVNKGVWRGVDQMRLASAAPEMAHTLIEIEWRGGETGIACPYCSGYDPKYEIAPVGHFPECALVAVLQKAGLR